MGKARGWVSVNLPIVGARRKPDISHKGKATDRIFVPTKRPDNLVLLPESDGLVRRACSPSISRVRAGKRRHILTSDKLFPIDGHNSQDRLSVTFQVIRQLEILPYLGCAVELLLSNLDQCLLVDDVPIPRPGDDGTIGSGMQSADVVFVTDQAIRRFFLWGIQSIDVDNHILPSRDCIT